MKWSVLSLSAILSILTGPAARAEILPADIEKIVRKADVLSPNVQVRGITKGPEIILSVYVADSVPETDLKIDTVMLAREFFSTDSALTITTINFFDPLKPQSYRSVSVRSTDVKAFGSGLVEKDELLSGIAVDKRTTAAATATTSSIAGEPADEKTTDTKTATAKPGEATPTASQPGRDRSSHQPAAPRTAVQRSNKIGAPQSGYVKYSVEGFAFYYPNDWHIAESEHSLLKLRNGSGGEISLQRSKSHTPEQAYFEGLHLQRSHAVSAKQTGATGSASDKYNWSKFRLTPVSYPKSLRFGIENRFPALQLAAVYRFPSFQTGAIEDHFDRAVYFGWPGKVFQFRVKSLRADAGAVNGIFEKLLSSMVVQR